MTTTFFTAWVFVIVATTALPTTLEAFSPCRAPLRLRPYMAYESSGDMIGVPGPTLLPNDVVVRRATQEDFPMIAASRAAVLIVASNAAFTGPQKLKVKDSSTERQLLARIPYLMSGQSTAYIATCTDAPSRSDRNEQRLLGAVDVTLRQPNRRLPRRVHFKNLFVDQAYRRMGLARRLLAEVEGHALQLGVSYVECEVLGNNLPARRLYEQRGFEYVKGGVMASLCRYFNIGRVTMIKRLPL